MKICLPSQCRSFIVKRNLLGLTCHLQIIFLMCFLLRDTSSDCPSVCDCKWKDGKESVMCINTNLTAIPKNLDPGVLVFNFFGNSLLTLGNDAFETVGLVNLQKLYLVKCNIKFIDRYAFRMLKNLVDLDLSHNVLTIVPSQTFMPIPDLRELKLNGNPILKIGSYAFTHVHQLIRLEISSCRIGYVDQKAFTGLENSLEWLKLNHNRLINVKPEAFTILRALHGLDLNENPLNCSCVIRPLRDWILDRSLSSTSLPVCRYPPHNSNRSWDRLMEDDFACMPSVMAPVKVVNAFEGDNVTLACKIGGTPAPNARWTLRNRVLLNSTFGYPVTNKRSYLIHSVSNQYSNLTILSLEMQDSGEYVCIAENKAGKVITDIALIIEKAPMGTILSEKVVMIGILLTAILIIFLCSVILFIRVMYCKHDTRADIESKRRIISEKIEMKRNSANMKRTSSVVPNLKSDAKHRVINEDGTIKADNVSLTEEDGSKPCRPKDFKELKSKPNSGESKGSPGSSIFESHIGEIALQHHVLHKKELPTGKLYTTAMAFMTDDVMMNYQNEMESSSSKKKAHYNTLPRNYSSSNYRGSSVRKNLSAYPKVSESQSPLLRSKYYGSSSESMNSNAERIARSAYHQHQSAPANYQRTYTPNVSRRSRNEYWVNPSLPTTPDKDKYWAYSESNGAAAASASGLTKETPLLNNIYKKSKNPYVNYSTYSEPSQNPLVEPVLAATYDYHAAQLERFLDEYKRLQSELTKMKDTCEKLSRDEDLGVVTLPTTTTTPPSRLYGSRTLDRRYRSRTSLDRSYGSSTFDPRRYSSRSSLHRQLTSKSDSFDHRLQSKSCSFERSVSFVPTLKEDSVKTTVSDDVIVPKSILKKRNESYYGYATVAAAAAAAAATATAPSNRKYNVDVPYCSRTLPLKKTRLRRFSDSSVEGFFD